MFPRKGIKNFSLVSFEAALLQNGPSGKVGMSTDFMTMGFSSGYWAMLQTYRYHLWENDGKCWLKRPVSNGTYRSHHEVGPFCFIQSQDLQKRHWWHSFILEYIRIDGWSHRACRQDKDTASPSRHLLQGAENDPPANCVLESRTVCCTCPQCPGLHSISWVRAVHPRSYLHGMISSLLFQPQHSEQKQGLCKKALEFKSQLNSGMTLGPNETIPIRRRMRCRVPWWTWEHGSGLLTPRTQPGTAFSVTGSQLIKPTSCCPFLWPLFPVQTSLLRA